jgi:hypothetical protein
VVRGRDSETVKRAVSALEDMLRQLGAAPQRINPADNLSDK